MSSKVLYPPTVDSYMPAFEAGNTNCRVYFSLSKFNGSSDFTSVHVSVVKQNTGMNVVKTTDDPANNKYRSTGIIINATPIRVLDQDNLYYVEIEGDDLSSVSGAYSGWIPGWTYKIQLRLSAKNYDGSIGQAAWLNNNASFFSEWSTICIVKATGKIDYDFPFLGIDTRTGSSISVSQGQKIYTSTLDLIGTFYKEIDPSELIRYYSFTLYDENDNVLERSGEIYVNQFQDNNSIRYLVKTELINNKKYKLEFYFITINGYEGGFYKKNEQSDNRFEFTCSVYTIEMPPCKLLTIENDEDEILKDITCLDAEEDEGRIGVKFCDLVGDIYSGNLCIRRSSSKENFQVWTDVYLFVCKQQQIDEIPIFYDYTAESGVWYKYGVQTISASGNRGYLRVAENPVMRNYNYSFILGKNNQQLKLMFDNSMANFKYQKYDTKVDPIGSKYAVVSRNTATHYRTFPVNGLVSFWMDENKVFCDKLDIYKYENIVNLYKQYNEDNNIVQYDYIYERDFRETVLDFLQDGEYKLFKSPTEGNIIVRLTEVNCVPNQSLGRMIYSFTSNAFEMDEPTMANYLKYGFYYVEPYASSFAIYETRLGQLTMDFLPNTDVIRKIYEKYDSQGRNIAGSSVKLANISYMKITFDDKPLRVVNSGGEVVLGNNFVYNGKTFTVYDPVRMYEFDNRIVFTPTDTLYLLGDAEGKQKTIHATIDFLYNVEIDVYVAKQIQVQQIRQGVAQFFKECTPNEDIYKEIRYKFYIEWPYDFQRLINLSSMDIEASLGATFAIKDNTDEEAHIHIVGATEHLVFYELENIASIKYLGITNASGELERVKTDVLLNYFYLITKGTYKEKQE